MNLSFLLKKEIKLLLPILISFINFWLTKNDIFNNSTRNFQIFTPKIINKLKC